MTRNDFETIINHFKTIYEVDYSSEHSHALIETVGGTISMAWVDKPKYQILSLAPHIKMSLRNFCAFLNKLWETMDSLEIEDGGIVEIPGSYRINEKDTFQILPSVELVVAGRRKRKPKDSKSSRLN